MKNIPEPGATKIHRVQITKSDIAAFNNGVVHEVCSTFALAREVEWSSRLFVLDMKEEDEEGIGTMLEIRHLGPAFVGEEVEIKAVVEQFEKNELICSYEARVKDRLVAKGRTGQKILKKERLRAVFNNIDQKS